MCNGNSKRLLVEIVDNYKNRFDLILFSLLSYLIILISHIIIDLYLKNKYFNLFKRFFFFWRKGLALCTHLSPSIGFVAQRSFFVILRRSVTRNGLWNATVFTISTVFKAIIVLPRVNGNGPQPYALWLDGFVFVGRRPVKVHTSKSGGAYGLN